MFPQNVESCAQFKEELYRHCKHSVENFHMLRRYTPDFCDDERINSLWLWCMENIDKYDPEKGTVKQWVSGVARRVIDVYRKEKGGKAKYETQFAEFTSERGEKTSAEVFVPDRGTTNSKYGQHEHHLDLKEECKNLMEIIDKVITKPQNNAILMNFCKQYSDDGMAEEMKLRLNTLQSRRTQYKTKVLNEIQKKNAEGR